MFQIIINCISIFIIAVTTQLYIATEETLVVIAFATFIAYAYANTKESVSDFFDNASKKIEDEFNSSTQIKRKQVELLINSYKKVNESIVYLIKLITLIKILIKTVVLNKKEALVNQLKLDIKEKLKNVLEAEALLKKSTQEKLIPLITKNVYTKNSNVSKRIKLENLDKINNMTIPLNIKKEKDIVLLSNITSIPVAILKLIYIYNNK